MKKHLLFTFALLFATLFTKAQTLSPTVIASAGNYSSQGSYSSSYTVGELAAVQTFTSSNDSIILTQGFQQPNDMVLGLLDIEKGANGSFSVYPIPARTTVWFGYEFSGAGNINMSLYNMLGQKLEYTLNEGYESGKIVHSFDCSAYASGSYILTARFTSSSGQEVILSKKIQIVTD